MMHSWLQDFRQDKAEFYGYKQQLSSLFGGEERKYGLEKFPDRAHRTGERNGSSGEEQEWEQE